MNVLEQKQTKYELRENFELTDLTLKDIAEQIGATPEYVEQLFELRSHRIEDPWILRNVILNRLEQLGIEPIPFSKLAGDWHDYWFLDGTYIDEGRIS